MQLLFYCLFLLFVQSSCAAPPALIEEESAIVLGANRLEQYLPQLEGKRVALVVNQTSTINSTHLVDSLQRLGVEIQHIYAPEHGFRGKADAGEKIKDGIDVKSKLPVISLYGSSKKPSDESLKHLDIVVFDIQDVGTRFYTYLSTLHYVMEACAENQKPLIVLDRPNPNGHFIDGPVLDLKFQSFVGMHPIPVVHGMTLGELAYMMNQEGWLKNKVQCDLSVIKMLNYNHQSKYNLPIAPSPNLPNSNSILFYPTLCFFEGTDVSIGRGTDFPFQVIGSPKMKQLDFQFVPKSTEGAKYPKHENDVCFGKQIVVKEYVNDRINLDILIEAFNQYNDVSFFTRPDFFNLLAGTDQLLIQIKAGLSEQEIRASWQDELNAFKQKRIQYLLYQDFE